MNLIENYNNALQEIYDHVGFVEDWVIYPVDDNTHRLWFIKDDAVHYADNRKDFYSGDCYSGAVYKQRFYSKWIYEGEKYTMIFMATGVDGMKYFAVFLNSKRIEPVQSGWI